MNERTIHILEFDKIRVKLSELCVSEMGKHLSLSVMPNDNIGNVLHDLEETKEADVLLSRSGSAPVTGFTDVRGTLKLAAIGATLTPKMLLEIAAVLASSRIAKEGLNQEKSSDWGLKLLPELAKKIALFRPIEDAISQAIISEEEVADRASPELYNIRRKIRSCNERVRERLNSMIHSPSFQKYLQDPIITMRSDRYVLPVKQEYRSMVSGIVHDQSTSGATLFIEPLSVVEIGNELKALMTAEKIEIDRILRDLSGRISPSVNEILLNIEVLAHLDFVFAKASLGHLMHGIAPKINNEGYIKIIKGRHPLIAPQAVVPLDIELGKDYTVLVITGPNTGGKTVTLKTAGLFCMMAQAGMFVPADFGTELPVFDEIFADIGDEQSIEQSLSTFSGHMKNIVSILQQATPNSMVLFDELGAGTDPTEGAALAQSILAKLLSMKTRTFATTHYSELKEYAMTEFGVENASMEFDISTLAPTYHLLIGIPGKSNAFEISRKLGLSESIIDNARALLSKDQIRFEDVLANAEMYRRQAEEEQALAEAARQEMVQLRNQAEKERAKLEALKKSFTDKAKADAKKIVENAQQQTENLLNEMRAIKKSKLIQEHEINEFRKKMNVLEESMEDHTDGTNYIVLSSVELGQKVHIISMDIDATVVALPDSKGYVQLKAGMMKARVKLSDLRSLTDEERRYKNERKKSSIYSNNSQQSRINIVNRQVRQEIDVRGMATDEAIPEVQKFLDDAMLSSLGEVVIIHGVGTGILRSKIQDVLKKHPSVRSFRAGKYGEGEAGVTIVSLK